MLNLFLNMPPLKEAGSPMCVSDRCQYRVINSEIKTKVTLISQCTHFIEVKV